MLLKMEEHGGLLLEVRTRSYAAVGTRYRTRDEVPASLADSRGAEKPEYRAGRFVCTPVTLHSSKE